MAAGLHSRIARAKKAWAGALQALSEDPSGKLHFESPIAVDHAVFGWV